MISFPHKERGDSLSAEHINNLGLSIGGIYSRNPSYGTGRPGEYSNPPPFDMGPVKISNLTQFTGDDEDSGLYLCKTLYFEPDYNDHVTGEWKTDDEEWNLDCRHMILPYGAKPYLSFLVDDLALAMWSVQRGAYLGIGRLSPRELVAVVTESGGIAINSSGEVTVKHNGTLSTETITAWYTHMSGVDAATENNDCIIRWFDDERKWIIVELEC